MTNPDPPNGDSVHGQPAARRPKRVFRDPGYKTKDRDTLGRAQLLKTLAEAGQGGVAGFLIGIAVDYKLQDPIPWAIVLGLLLWAMAALLGGSLAGASGWFVGKIHAPSGGSTPYRQQYSGALALARQGKVEEAIAAYEQHIAQDPADPEPYFAIVRLLRDKLGRAEDASTWLRRVYRDSRLDDGKRLLAIREYVELYRVRLEEPLRAAPWLAQIAETRSGTRDGDFAAEQLAEIRAEMSEEEEA